MFDITIKKSEVINCDNLHIGQMCRLRTILNRNKMTEIQYPATIKEITENNIVFDVKGFVISEHQRQRRTERHNENDTLIDQYTSKHYPKEEVVIEMNDDGLLLAIKNLKTEVSSNDIFSNECR